MDINDLRSIFTLLVFFVFIGIAAWAYSPKRKQAFDEAAHLPLDDDEPPLHRGGAGQQHN